MDSPRWMDLREGCDESGNYFKGLVDAPDNFIPLRRVEFLGRTTTEKPLRTPSPRAAFTKKSTEEVEARAQEIGATIIARPCGTLARRKDYKGFYLLYRETTQDY